MKSNFDYMMEYLKMFIVTTIVFLIILLLSLTVEAKEVRVFTYDQLANAIFHAEGGNKAQYLYGIRSVHYDSKEEARRICINTIRNNIKRFKDYGHKNYKTYLSFLHSRYCPTNGNTLSKAERKLNKHWLNNVKWFLNNPKEVSYAK